MAGQFVRGVSVSAKRGVRRSPAQISAHFGRTLPRRDALQALAVPDVRARAVKECQIVTWDGTDTRVGPVARLSDIDLAALRPVRRLGSFPKARSNLVLHATRFGGEPAVVWAESKTEWLHLLELDRRADVRWYGTQACVLSWPVGDRCILQIPDVLVASNGGVEVISVRAESNLSDYARTMLAELMPETMLRHGVSYQLLGELSQQYALNLRMLGAMRWKQPVTEEPWWSEAAARCARSMGAVAATCGGGPSGRALALRALAQCHFDTQLDRRITEGSAVVWR